MINSSQLGGWLSIHEDRTEWTCISNWLMTKYKPSYQKFAISLREDYISGIFLWHYPDGTTTFPLYEVWAPNHPGGWRMYWRCCLGNLRENVMLLSSVLLLAMIRDKDIFRKFENLNYQAMKYKVFQPKYKVPAIQKM